MKLRSDKVKLGIERAPHRSLFKAAGLSDRDLKKPLIALANSWTEIVPGHIHLRQIADAVKDGVWEAGGTPLEFNTIAICDGVAMAHPGMRNSLPSRDLIADSVELEINAHGFDGMVCICSCDKIVPGMLMAACRLDIPTIFVTGGPMLAGRSGLKKYSFNSVYECVSAVKAGKMSAEELKVIEDSVCPGAGSCAGLYTANTMQCLTEALGLSLPYSGTTPAVHSQKLQMARMSGLTVLCLVKKQLTPRRIVTEKSLENAIMVDMALGGSSNTVLHLIAVANEENISLNIEKFDTVSRVIPHLCDINPSGQFFMEDLHQAGGIPAVMKEISSHLNLECLTVTGKSIRENIRNAFVSRREVIRSIDNPIHPEGGIAILKGSLAPDGAVVKQSAVHPSMLRYSGVAVTFDSEEDAVEAVFKGEISEGSVIVIRYEGPRGGPGMREMLGVTSAVKGLKMDTVVALVTDGRFSGATTGPCIGHVSPEAVAKGPIAIVENGDEISIDIPARKLNLEVSADEVTSRLEKWKRPRLKVRVGYLSRYSKMVSSASKGAVLNFQ